MPRPDIDSGTLVRLIALDTLLEWEEGEEFARDIMARRAQGEIHDSRDAALLQNIIFTTLRNLSLLDHWISRLASSEEIDRDLRWILRIGLAQLVILRVAPHAAVNETVNLARHAGAMVNAVLRRAQRELIDLESETGHLPLDIRLSHPRWLVDRWTAQFGEEDATALCEWNQRPAPGYIRINRLHAKPLLPIDLHDLAPAKQKDFFIATRPPREWLAQGRCYAQDPSTAVACELLAPQPSDTVLDACAAPGGKTALLAQMMKNEGRIVATDSSPRRIPRLQENLRKLNVKNARIFEHDWLSGKVTFPWGALRFDRILLDAPCSNTGVMRRRIDVRWRIKESSFAGMAASQSQLLSALLAQLKPGGSLVYSTCSIDAEENERVVESVLKSTSGFTLQETRSSLPWRDEVDGAFAAKIVRDVAS